jgi:ABC-type nitrate/sulfonate/bicarbonate transport system substrate-binding protein
MKRALAFLPLAAALFSAAPGWSAGQPQPPVRILVPQTTAALPFLIMARDQSVAGAQISVSFFANHAQALALLLRGDAELLLSGTSQGWENRLDGSPLVMVDSGVWGISSLVGKDASITGFTDLKGKRIAMPFPGSPLDFQSRALLAFDKLDPDKDVTFSYGPFPQSLQRLQAGQVDAVALPEPLATSVVRQNGLKRLVDYSKAWARLTGGDPQSPQVSLFTSEQYAADHRSLMAAVVAAWDAATRAVNADPAAAAAQFSAALAVDAGILEEATRNTLLAVPSPAENKTRVLAYYALVARYLPAGNRPLDGRFFFIP